MRILLAGVPFGCDNVGDEAILECAVQIFREVAPDATITASTRDHVKTAEKLNIETCGLLGFFGDVSPAETEAILKAHDCFVWCGATGLSDYPHVTTALMRSAQKLGKKTVLWGVGMNDELNPAFHRVLPGKRRTLLKGLSLASLGLVDAVALAERRRNAQSRRKIAQCLSAAELVVVRDTQSREEVKNCGVTREVIVGADSAIRMKPAALETISLTQDVRDLIFSSTPKIGLCVSAQGPIAKEEELAACLDAIMVEADAQVVCIPMNPVTDCALMTRLAGHMENRDRFRVIEGEFEPAEVLAIAARMNVIVSSRLHLLILAAVANVPIVGIARGSKVDNFLHQFGLISAGSVDECDFVTLKEEILGLMDAPQPFRDRAETVMIENGQRLDAAKQKLSETLTAGQ